MKKEERAKKKIRDDTKSYYYFIILKKNILHVLEVRRKMMRKYDVEWKDTYIYILTTTLNYLLFNLFILLIKNHNDNQTCYVHMRL